MKRSPTLVILVTTASALPVNYLVLSHLASTQASISTRWTTFAGLLVVAATLLGYWLADGRDPIPTRDRVLYSLIAACMNAASGYLNFLAMARAWRNAALPPEHQDFFHQLLHPEVLGELAEVSRHGSSWGTGWLGAVAVGFLAGGAVTYYSFRYFTENQAPEPLSKQ